MTDTPYAFQPAQDAAPAPQEAPVAPEAPQEPVAAPAAAQEPQDVVVDTAAIEEALVGAPATVTVATLRAVDGLVPGLGVIPPGVTIDLDDTDEVEALVATGALVRVVEDDASAAEE